jgi:hypothetical protein
MGRVGLFGLELSAELIEVEVMFSLVGWAEVNLGDADGVDNNEDPDKEFLSSSFLDSPTAL